MPDLAWNVSTGDVVDAREVAAAPHLIPGPWQCPGCDVAMTPVACGAAGYRVSPHFRANGKHGRECQYDGWHSDVRHGEIRRIRRTMGPPASMPTLLRLAGPRPELCQPDQDGPGSGTAHAYRDRPDADGKPAPHESTSSMLHRVAAAYCRYPLERSRPLRIPECPGCTYGACIRQLRNTNGELASDNAALFAQIRFRAPRIEPHAMTIHLEPAHWKEPYSPNRRTPPDSVYCVSFRTETWKKRDRDRFRYELQKAVKNQRQDHNDRDKTWQTYLFFLGRLDKQVPALFNVNDHRLACFLRLHKTVYRKL